MKWLVEVRRCIELRNGITIEAESEAEAKAKAIRYDAENLGLLEGRPFEIQRYAYVMKELGK